MKKLSVIIFLSLCGLLMAMNVNAVQVRIQGKQAKMIYEALTGKAVKNQGAAGHFYRQGKSIFCQYINADITDSHGKNLPAKDPNRYACTLQFNKNGLAAPTKHL